MSYRLEDAWARKLVALGNIHPRLADSIGNPKRVYCRKCGRSQPVDAAECLRHGWPLCCRETMTIDAPAEPA